MSLFRIKEKDMDPLKAIETVNAISRKFFSENKRVYDKVLDEMVECLNRACKILVFGNGGSASQAQHFSAELVNRFQQDRSALAALALTTDTSALTSIANDMTFEFVFSRQVQALGKKGDIALGLSTSGNSPNMIQAFKSAREQGLLTIALTGCSGGQLAAYTDLLLPVDSEDTPRIQEVHLLLLHLIAEHIERFSMLGTSENDTMP